jgi:predicted nucleic acid-binding protein
VSVIDASGVFDLLTGGDSARQVEALFFSEVELAAPDLIVYEVISGLRRAVIREALDADRASAAVSDLGDLKLDLSPSLPLRERAWELRHNLTAGDALFVALAEQLGEPLATKDRGLAAAAKRAGIETIELDSA